MTRSIAGPSEMMMTFKRIAVVLSLASYLLASTAIHALHDHSGRCGHAALSCAGVAFHQSHHDGSAFADACHDAADRHSPNNCEVSCFACRFVAAKAIVPVIVLPVERFQTVCQVEPQEPGFAPLTQVECSLYRGPPSAG